MFYDTKDHHNLLYNPFKSCVVPRPIGWISSMNPDGSVNLAPYSYFNAVADIPPMIMFSSGFKADGTSKDTLRNIEMTKEFVVNVATFEMRDKVQISSTALPYGESESKVFDIELEKSEIVKTPRVKSSPIHLECRYIKTVDLDFDSYNVSSRMVIGHVVGIHIADHIIVDGKIDITKFTPIARLGYDEYAKVTEIFRMKKL